MLLKNKVAVITGGTRGIGFEIAHTFLNEGASVVILGSREETVTKALKELKSSFPNAKIKGMHPDLTSFKEMEEAIKEIINEFKVIDILVNNAGVSDDHQFIDYTEELFDKVMNLNVKGIFNPTKAVVPFMIKEKKGVILNTSSIVSRDGSAGGIAYPTSKAAVNGFTLSLARELAPYNIRVNAVAPGVTNTDMVKAVPDEYIKPLIASIPLKRLGTPEDIANMFLYLASDKGSYISGQVYFVDGLVRN